MFAAEGAGLGVEHGAVERARGRPFPAPAEGGLRILVEPDQIAVPPRGRAESRVEFRFHLVRRRDPEIGGEHGVERAAEFGGRPFRRHAYAGRLPPGVNARVGAAGAERRDRRIAQSREGVFERRLHRALIGLALPARESCAVVLQHELDGALRHARKLPAA